MFAHNQFYITFVQLFCTFTKNFINCKIGSAALICQMNRYFIKYEVDNNVTYSWLYLHLINLEIKIPVWEEVHMFTK